jgi:raffinose/stachyose/melibiose transport system substrate-binding protein
MKRILSCLLALTLLLTSATAFASVRINAMTALTDTGSIAAHDWMVQEMKARYDIDVEMMTSTYQDMKLAIESGDMPTLVYLDDLWQMTIQKYGYLKDLTGYVEQYDWIGRSTPGAVEYQNLRTPGKYYSVAMLQAPVVVYYNKDIFDAIGATVPTTYAELKEVLQKAKDAGYVGFEVGGSNCHNLMWSIFCMLFTSCPMEDVNKWYYLEETTDAFKEALLLTAAEVADWVEKGYLREDVLGIDDSLLSAMFGLGESAMMVGGDWSQAMVEETGLAVGAFCFPVVKEEFPLYIVNATYSAWCITSDATEEETDAALKFIDLSFDQECVEKWVEAGYTPTALWDSSQYEMSPLKVDMMNSIATAGMGFYMDNAAPGMLEVTEKLTQSLVAREITPAEYVDKMMAEYEALKALQLEAMAATE